MLTLLTGDYQKCINYIKQNKIIYASNILDEIKKMSGFLRTKQSIYFVYDKSLFSTKDKVNSFLTKIKNKDIYCIADNITKSDILYKSANKKINFPEETKTKDIYDMDVSDLYKLLYCTRKKQDKLVIENAINYIVNGTLSQHNAIQYIILKSSLF